MLEHQYDFLTVDELCELLKIGRNAAYRLLNSGEIKALRNGSVGRIPKEGASGYQKRSWTIAFVGKASSIIPTI